MIYLSILSKFFEDIDLNHKIFAKFFYHTKNTTSNIFIIKSLFTLFNLVSVKLFTLVKVIIIASVLNTATEIYLDIMNISTGI